MVVEAAPAAALIVAEPDLLLEVLIIAFDPPAQLGQCDQLLEGRGGSQGGEEVLGRLRLAARPFDQQPLFGPRGGPPGIPMGGANAHRRKPGSQWAGAALPPGHRTVAGTRQRQSQGPGGHRLMPGITPHQLGWPSPAAIGIGRQRLKSRRPYRRRGLDADHVKQLPARDLVAEVRVIPVAGVRQHGTARHARAKRSLNLPQRDLRLGPEGDLVRDPGLPPPPPVCRPFLGQIQTPSDRQARRLVRHGQAHCNLTVVLLAELSAVLSRHADRVLALLRKTRVVDDPGPDRPPGLDGRQRPVADRRQQRFIAPRCIGHEVMHRLMERSHPPRIDPRRHRLDALAISRQHQTHAIGPQRRRPIGVPCRYRQPLDKCSKP
jgi:hypothetical protein